MGMWHAPTLFQATLNNDLIHSLQHLSFLLSALLFWWALLRGREARTGYGMAVLYVFTTGVHSSVLGALLTFSPRVWYPVYAESTGGWGLNALADQQIGGLIMWVPAGLIFLGAGLALFANWIRQPARAAVICLAFGLVPALPTCSSKIRIVKLSRLPEAMRTGDKSRSSVMAAELATQFRELEARMAWSVPLDQDGAADIHRRCVDKHARQYGTLD